MQMVEMVQGGEQLPKVAGLTDRPRDERPRYRERQQQQQQPQQQQLRPPPTSFFSSSLTPFSSNNNVNKNPMEIITEKAKLELGNPFQEMMEEQSHKPPPAQSYSYINMNLGPRTNFTTTTTTATATALTTGNNTIKRDCCNR